MGTGRQDFKVGELDEEKNVLVYRGNNIASFDRNNESNKDIRLELDQRIKIL